MRDLTCPSVCLRGLVRYVFFVRGRLAQGSREACALREVCASEAFAISSSVLRLRSCRPVRQLHRLANGIARKKPFKSKRPCPINLSTGKRFGLNTDGTAFDPPKAFVERTIIGKGARLWISL